MTLPGAPVAVSTELFYSGAWHDESTLTYNRDSLTATRGLPDQTSSASPSAGSFTLNNRDGRFSPTNPNSPLYGLIGRNTPCRLRAGLTLAANYGLALPQETSVDSATTPDNAALDIVGDIDLAAEFTPLGAGSTQTLITKGTVVGVTGTQFSYALLIGYDTTGTIPHMTLRWSTNGTAFLFVDQPLSGALVVGQHMAVRATLQVNDGAGHRVLKFYTSSNGTISGTWNQLGSTTTTTGTTSIFSGSGVVSVGADGSTDTLHGIVHAVLIKSGIAGTAVANPTFNTQTAAATSFTDPAGRVWTVNTGAYIGYYRFTRFVGEVSALPSDWDITGNDVFSQVTAAGVSRRLGQGQKGPPTDPVNTYAASSGAVRYWSGASEFDSTGQVPFNQIGPTGVVFGAGTLGGKSQVAQVPPSTLTRGPNIGSIPGYFENGYVTGLVQHYDPNHAGLGFVYQADSLGTLFIVLDGYYAPDGSQSEFEIWLRNDGVNNDVVLLNRSYNFITHTFSAASLGDSAPISAISDGAEHTVFLALDKNGTGVDWRISIDGVSFINGTLASQALGTANEVHFAYSAESDATTPVNLGYFTAWVGSSVPTAAAFTLAALRYVGESASARISRLAALIPVAAVVSDQIGAGDTTPLLGVQSSDGSLLDAINEAANTDLGFLVDSRAALGLTYITRTSLYNQASDVTIDYTAHILAGSPKPTYDDLNVYNDVTASNTGGGSAEQMLTTGALSVQAPPNGINQYPTTVSVNTDGDGPLNDIASWVMNRSTVNKARYPALPFNMLTPAITSNPTLANQLALLDVGSQLTLTKLPSQLAPDDVPLLAIGLADSFTQVEWTIALNCTPGDPYQVGLYGSARFDAENSTVGTGFTTTATTGSIASAAHTELWTTDVGDVPFDINIAGERITVTAITGSSSPQTFTMTRSVNGVVKAHIAGEAVHLWTQYRYGL